MIMEQYINEYITKHVFPKFRELPNVPMGYGRMFAIGLNDNNRVAVISPFDSSLNIIPESWSFVQCMFSLTEDETVNAFMRWFRDNFPLLEIASITLLKYP